MNCVERMIQIAKDHGITTDSEFARVTGIPALKVIDFYSGKTKSVYTDTIEIFCKAFNISIAEFFQENILDDKYQLPNQLHQLINYKKNTFTNFTYGEITFVISDNKVVNLKHTECIKIPKGTLMTE